MLNKLPKEIQTIIYKHLFNSVLDDLKVTTNRINNHFVLSKPFNKYVHDCNDIDVMGFDNGHEIVEYKCAYSKIKNEWDIDYYGKFISSWRFDENYNEDDLNNYIDYEEDYDSF